MPHVYNLKINFENYQIQNKKKISNKCQDSILRIISHK